LPDNPVPTIAVDQETCIRCGACVAVCRAARVFELGDEAAEAVRPQDCWLCGHCVAVCPVDAVHHTGYPLDACPTVDRDALPSFEDLVGALRARRSLRVFRDKPVPRETVRRIVDVSRWAPSASNKQSIDWIALDDPDRIADLRDAVVETLDRTAQLLQIRLLRPFLRVALGPHRVSEAVDAADTFQDLARRHAEGEDLIFYNAPLVLAAHVPVEAFLGRDDAVYAAYNVMLAAESLGLGTCQIGYVNAALERNDELTQIIGLPEGRKLELTMILGYPRFAFKRAPSRGRRSLAWNPS